MNKYKKSWSYLIVGSTMLLALCSTSFASSHLVSNLGNTEHTQSLADKLKDNYFAVRMGSGYDTSSHTATSGQSCLKASGDQSNIFIANPNALIDFKEQTDLS